MDTFEAPPVPPPLEEPKKKTNTALIIVIVVLLVLCCFCLFLVLAGYWLWENGDALLGISQLLSSNYPI